MGAAVRGMPQPVPSQATIVGSSAAKRRSSRREPFLCFCFAVGNGKMMRFPRAPCMHHAYIFSLVRVCSSSLSSRCR